ncbi:MAG: hypothetical protein FOGNACKC_06446 [Anaerolineae bacterium]|nr:hypothetical protein [Anaerolineae bacterium]
MTPGRAVLYFLPQPITTDSRTFMSFGITKTIPAADGIAALNALYDGSLSEFEFHMAGQPSKLNVGDYVYTIFNDQLHGRLRIKALIGGAVNPASGKPRTLIMVDCPGQRLPQPIPKKGHRGTRYTDGDDWPAQ